MNKVRHILGISGGKDSAAPDFITFLRHYMAQNENQ